MRSTIEEFCNEADESAIFFEGFDDAIVGSGYKFHSFSVVYSKRKIIEILCKDMDYDEALEYFDFNISGGYLGENTPFIIDDLD